MNMEYFLPGSFAVSQEKVDPFILYIGAPQAQRNPLRDLEKVAANVRGQITEIYVMRFRYDKDMTRVHWLDIHECQTDLIRVHVARGSTAFHDFAKDAGCHVTR